MADYLNIAGRVRTTANDGISLETQEIFDNNKGKKQDVINAEVIDDLRGNEGLKGRVEALEEQVAFSGDFQVASTASEVIAGSGKITDGGAVRGAIDVRTGYFVCDTAAATAAKVVTATGFVLTNGGALKIKMANANTANNATLNINSTGAKALIYDGARASADNSWEAGEVLDVYYDATNEQFVANNAAGGGKFSTGEKVKKIGIETSPTVNSTNLATSGGIFAQFTSEGIFDVSVNNLIDNNPKTYTSLSDLLTNHLADIPVARRKGGMIIKFIQSSDNKYVQYRYMSTSTAAADFTNVANWQGVDNSLVAGSKNPISSGAVFNTLGGESTAGFNVTGHEHSSTKDRIYVKIQKGEKLVITPHLVTAVTGTWQVYAIPADGSESVRLGYAGLETETEFVATFDIVAIGFYFTISQAGSVEYTIQKKAKYTNFLSGENITNVNIDKDYNPLDKGLVTNAVLGSQLLNSVLKGKGNDTVGYTIKSLIPGNTYRLCFANIPWAVSEVTENYTVFEIIQRGADNSVLSRIAYTKPVIANIPKYIEFKADENLETFYIGGRADTNENVRFSIVDITYSKSTNSNGILVTKDYLGSTTDNIYSIKRGKTYTLHLSSSTGITYDGPEQSTLWIEIYYTDGSATRRVYTLNKSSEFEETTIIFTATADSILKLNPLRIGSNEIFTLKLYDGDVYNSLVRTTNQVLTNEQKNQVFMNLGIAELIPTITNINSEALEFVFASKSKLYSYGSTTYNRYPTILVMTDSHADWTRVTRGFELAKEDVFDIACHLGDIVEGSGLFSRYDWESQVLSLNKPMLAITGNHEYEYVANSTTYIGLTDEETKELLYSDTLIAHNGEVHPTINNEVKNYYYKDVTKNGKTLRIIGLYQFEWNSPQDGSGHPVYGDGQGKDVCLYTQDQIDWLVQTLQNTPTTYGVILISHMPVTKFTYLENEFVMDSLKGTVVSDRTLFCRLSNKYFFYSIIDAFVNGGTCSVTSNQETPDGVNHPISVNANFEGGGLFVVNICGHTHYGGQGYMIDSNNEVSDYRVIVCPATSAADNQQHGWWGRDSVGKIQDCLDALTYNFDLDKISIIRFGSTINHNLKEAKTVLL